MKKQIRHIAGMMILLTGILFSSCDDFLNILPKGEKIPTTLADFDAFVRNESNHLNDITQAINLLNDFYVKPSALGNVSLSSINYNWMEGEDRIAQNNSDEGAYYYSYTAISNWNLIISSVPDATECTETEKQELIAQAKVLRAMNYFYLVNYYADVYDASTAASKLSVPLIESADMGAPSTQVTIEKMYEFILKDLTDALPALPDEGKTVLHPNKGCGYAMLARVYLTMENYDEALANAEEALKQNKALFDWRAYYEENKEQIEKPDDWSTSYPAITLTNPENYIFRYGTNPQKNGGQSALTGALTTARATLFEAGDARFASRWKAKYEAPDDIFYGIRNDKFNGGGISTPEMYYIKAECLARKGGQENLDDAMEVLNTVREKRIFEDDYTPLVATSVEQAVKYIIQEKANEYVQTGIPFWDARRLNKDSKYARTLTKEFDGKTLTLSPTSHLWTMPFPLGATSNPGNGTLQQNVER
jgi:hypothetical protein